jgi:hypothetical protein
MNRQQIIESNQSPKTLSTWRKQGDFSAKMAYSINVQNSYQIC